MREGIIKAKGQPTELEKILENQMSDKELKIKKYKKLMQLIPKKQPNQKVGRSKQTFLQRSHKDC